MRYYSESGVSISYGTEGAAGIDLPFYDPNVEEMEIAPGQIVAIPTGVHIEIPKSYVGFLDTRSSTGKKKGMDLMCRVIDSDFRGNIHLVFINHGEKYVVVKRGDYLAQILILFCPQMELEQVEKLSDLSETVRGDKGFGEGSGR